MAIFRRASWINTMRRLLSLVALGCEPGGDPNACHSQETCEAAAFSWCTALAYCNDEGEKCGTLCECCDNLSDCDAAGCFWCDGLCGSDDPCDGLEQTECESHDCCLWDGIDCSYVPGGP